METLTAQNEEALREFIIEASLVDPLTKIIANLKNGNYRDCDIKWLDSKLEVFIKFAAETLGVKNILTPSQIGSGAFTILNDHNTKYYLTKFETLLTYFKNIR